ncbi:M1 family metallopeptidase [Hugenholtzia roseola]|uniref:M1 family metallopeptidase n=1 Tax=Hugenholtzia roseola TaxID=1002 RepID=UPI00047DA02A|nr:M1 family metallopeptidase [Hugenholtzia roseola]
MPTKHSLFAQNNTTSLERHKKPHNEQSKFAQLEPILPTPNVYRTGSGAPGHQYWQQKADYKMSLVLDDEKQWLYGKETITYTNNSPDVLTYLWVQLDQNLFKPESDTYKTQTGDFGDRIDLWNLQYLTGDYQYDGGFNIKSVTDTEGKPLNHTINKTMMRIELEKPLRKGDSYSFKIEWDYHINDQLKVGGRSGYEFFPEDGNYLYEMAQFFPRMAVYDDVNGWQNKQFLGRGEFALPFGDYEVEITAPADHVVGATGVLQNPDEVLSQTQRKRLDEAQTANRPVLIVSEAEARQAEKGRNKNTKTWKFKAENVRDYGWASSRKFVWDAMGVKVGDKTVMAMSYYPKEGNPLWGQYSTEAVAHTLEVYSKYTIEYPYPVAISVHGPVWGMEYPMICFNGGRPEPDGTYSDRIKYAMISVIIHEVGHNFFPMIVNSDERQWTWMDEGLNTFLQYLAEQEWERNYPSRRGAPSQIVEYMKGEKAGMNPIMTNSESILQFGNNAYGKPATALNILRETIMGRELFDYAFKEYAKRWAFKHPMPADFFRTMEDASAVDLDWFWHGWFYTNDCVDIAITQVEQFEHKPNDGDYIALKNYQDFTDISDQRNLNTIPQTRIERKPELRDFYNQNPEFVGNRAERNLKADPNFLGKLSSEEKAFFERNKHFYQVTFENYGGLVMPLLVQFEYEDGTKELQHIPAEVWRYNNEKVVKVFATKKPVRQIVLDPHQQTADIEMENNFFPRKEIPTRFQLYKRNMNNTNPMQQQKKKN